MIISIIIAVKTWQKNLEECVNKCFGLDYADFEIIILPDELIQYQGQSPACRQAGLRGTVPVYIVPTGPVSPATKRDMALKHVQGEILAFIDDDAYPDKDWLKVAAEHFKDERVAAVGGPGVTPDSDSLRQKASGLVYSSLLVSGKYSHRYAPRKKQEVDDFPSCNLLVRKSAFQQLGGFNTVFWPAEDTKLCLDITKKLGRKIIYDPEVLVYHHRRPLFLPHLKQVASYALHRGYFAKKYPQTSLRAAYFLPSVLAIVIIAGGTISLFFAGPRTVYLGGLLLYLLLVFIFSVLSGLRFIPLVFPGIILTHLVYGLYFLKGLLSGKLAEERAEA